MIVTYILSRTFSKLLQIIGQIVAVGKELPLINTLVWGVNPYTQDDQISPE